VLTNIFLKKAKIMSSFLVCVIVNHQFRSRHLQLKKGPISQCLLNPAGNIINEWQGHAIAFQ
jgi:hypothetical protein